MPGTGFIRFGCLKDLDKISRQTAAVFLETVQGEAGVVRADRAYFQALRQRCSETGALLVLDEIQAGFGRTGSFWAFEPFGIQPDVLVMAKAMGAGMPLGAFAGKAALMKDLSHDPVLGHISTFGGHPLSCAAALAGLHFMQENQLCSHVAEKEALFRTLLVHPRIRELRSSGLLMALELGSFESVLQSIRYCLSAGLITDWFLNCDTAIRIAPPLIISEEEIRTACRIILESLDYAGE